MLCGDENGNAAQYHPTQIRVHADDAHRDYECVHALGVRAHDDVHVSQSNVTTHQHTSVR